MTIMVSLKSGVVLKLLEDMKFHEYVSEDFNKPALLQIRSIIPVLEEGNLWPDRFYLKVSDMSHAIYVSLPQDQTEMILSNKLELGQFIYVQKLEKSEPFPLLIGIRPVPGRRQCEGTPEDIVSMEKFSKLRESSEVDSIVEKGVISENKFETIPNSTKISRRLSDPHALVKKRDGLERPNGRCRSLSASKVRPGAQVKKLNILSEMADAEKKNAIKSRSSSVDFDSDSDSTFSSVSSTRVSKRRSWTESEILGVKEVFDSSVVKQEVKLPPRRCRSSNVSPVRSVRHDNSDDNSSSARRRDTNAARRLFMSPSNSKSSITNMKSEQNSCSICPLISEKKTAETGISWTSLPSSLVKSGKEVLRQRDVALLAAADALQEACAAERLLNCLSSFSEFQLSEGDDLEPYVDKFFDLQDVLVRTRMIMQSLTNISPLRASETDSSNTGSVKEALSIAVERKKNATIWIRSAMAVDLSPCSTTLNPITTTSTPSRAAKRSAAPNRSTKPKIPNIIKKHRDSDNFFLVLASEKDDRPEWRRGSTLSAAAGLATSLQDEYRRLFLGYIEKFLDEADRKTSTLDSDIQIAGMLYKVKKVDKWLDLIENKEANASKDGFTGGSNVINSEFEDWSRMRNKVYEILLKYVDRTAISAQ